MVEVKKENQSMKINEDETPSLTATVVLPSSTLPPLSSTGNPDNSLSLTNTAKEDISMNLPSEEDINMEDEIKEIEMAHVTENKQRGNRINPRISKHHIDSENNNPNNNENKILKCPSKNSLFKSNKKHSPYFLKNNKIHRANSNNSNKGNESPQVSKGMWAVILVKFNK